MSQRPGKKIGTLKVTLDRKKTRYKWASVDVELRFEMKRGTFHAQYEGNWYEAKTQDELSDQIKAAATKALSIEWKRYIQIDYEAEGHPIEDPKSGRPAISGTYHTFEINEDRSKFGRGRDENEPFAICAVKLQWTICEISEPYALPEEPRKLVRARRPVSIRDYGSDRGTEQIGDQEEWEDDVLPPGTLLWTPEREAVLVEILAALGRLDAKLVDLFRGDENILAGKIDAAQADASRLLAAPAVAESHPSKKQRRRV
ncbi:MAG TPA: hypothetical protein VLE97_06435 [Gaiellaceae bacterium]|nr:hypothetical protein [Gaiellaceae bacterium]